LRGCDAAGSCGVSARSRDLVTGGLEMNGCGLPLLPAGAILLLRREMGIFLGGADEA
jgi:hypothetical protein